jgi:hypothetical protein
VEAIGIGAVILRRRSTGRNWIVSAETGRPPAGSASAQLLRLFSAQEALAASSSEDDLLGEVFASVEGQRIEQVIGYRDGGYQVDHATVLLEEDIGLACQVDPITLQVLLRLDGLTTLGQLIDQAADETDVDRAMLVRASLRVVAALFGLGLLRRVTD